MFGCISPVFLTLILITSDAPAAEAKCPDGYHLSPSGDCEKVSSGETDNTSLRPEENSQEESNSETAGNNKLSFVQSTELTQSSECRGEADHFNQSNSFRRGKSSSV